MLLNDYSDGLVGGNLVHYRGRFVGVGANVDNVQSARRNNLEGTLNQEIMSALNAQRVFEYNGVVYAPVQGVILKNQ
ncbi:hypothetical protein HY639_03840 [Candidatus Woesearchaeota archaeon]|nr:hypothetical protein [Candidatus Woesearchaeota archaeon]